MKLILARNSLAKALDFVTRTVERRTTIPILSNVRLDADQDGLTLTATNLDMESKTRIAADVQTPGALTVPAAMLHDIIRKFAEGAQVSFEKAESRLAVKSGRAKFHLQSLPVDDFPSLEAGELTHKFALTGRTLGRALQKCAFAISNEETRYYLNGVYMHGTEGKLRLVATDGHRLARFEAAAPPGAEGMPGLIIPRAACIEIQKWAAKAEGDDVFEIAVSAQKIVVSKGETRLLSKLIDGSFPDYERVIPKSNDRPATLDKSALSDAIDRVSTLSSERGRAVKMVFAEGKLTLSVTNADAGDATEEIEADFDGAALEIGFNAKYVIEALAALDGETAHLDLNDSQSPTILRSESGGDLLIVLMPMRV